MNWYEMTEAIKDAKQDIKTADRAVRELAGMTAGRLRVSRVNCDVLKQLKKELRGYNIHTGQWKGGGE